MIERYMFRYPHLYFRVPIDRMASIMRVLAPTNTPGNYTGFDVNLLQAPVEIEAELRRIDDLRHRGIE